MKKFFILILVLILVPQIVFARPEYAQREKAACLNCHASPFGGGHRNVFGKMYGSRKLGKPLTNEYKNFYADFRAIYKRDEGNNLEGGSNGFALMSSEISGMVNVTEEEEGFSTSAVASYDLSALSNQVRNSFILFTNADKKAPIYSILVGKTYIPFGLLTDDHRSYLRMQTNTSYNKDFEMGVTLSGTPFFKIHYDLTLMNGFQKAGFNSGDETTGFNANLNWNPAELPILLGASHVMHYSRVREKGASPYASSFYGILDLREPTGDKVPVTFLGEVVFANHFNTGYNTNIAGRFVDKTTHPAYYAAIANSTSRGISGQVKWDINNKWQVALRHEQLLLDKRFAGDAYDRQAAAVTYQFTANSSLLGTVEKAKAKKPGINETGKLFADTDTYFLLFRTWL